MNERVIFFNDAKEVITSVKGLQRQSWNFSTILLRLFCIVDKLSFWEGVLIPRTENTLAYNFSI